MTEARDVQATRASDGGLLLELAAVSDRGGMQEMASMYRAFRGRDPIVEPLLIERGLKSPTQPTEQK